MSAGEAEVADDASGFSARIGAALSLPALGAILFWSGVSPFGKYAMDGMPAMVYIALRPLLAAALVSWFGVGATRPAVEQPVGPGELSDAESEQLVPIHRNYSCPVSGQSVHPPPVVPRPGR